MADTNRGTITFALPEDTEADFLQLWSSATEDGVYAQVGADIAYEYGTTTYEFDIGVTTYYKIRFRNNTDSTTGPFSDPVYGGDWNTNTSPFLAVGTTTDGAMYATIQMVYDYTSLTSSDVTSARVSQALRRARAIIDLKAAELDIDRFKYQFEAPVARRKYNAALRIIREAEINYTLGMLYRGLADDKVMEGIRSEGDEQSLSIGSAALTQDGGSTGSSSAVFLNSLGTRFLLTADALLDMLSPPSITISWQDRNTRVPRFVMGGKGSSKFLDPTTGLRYPL
jgi:hypothetical protein